MKIIEFNNSLEETGYIGQIRTPANNNLDLPSSDRSSPQEAEQIQPPPAPIINNLNFIVPTDLSSSSTDHQEERSEVSERDIQAAMIFENYESPAQEQENREAAQEAAQAQADKEGVTSPTNISRN